MAEAQRPTPAAKWRGLRAQVLWQLALQPAFAWYAVCVLSLAAVLALHVAPRYGATTLLVPIAICSLVGSLSVMSCKALGTALRLTVAGDNQLIYRETWFCAAAVVCFVLVQMNFLNRALDVFSAALVTPIYYVAFTSLTILASVIMFREWEAMGGVELATVFCGFCTIMGGVYLLHAIGDGVAPGNWKPLRKPGDETTVSPAPPGTRRVARTGLAGDSDREAAMALPAGAGGGGGVAAAGGGLQLSALMSSRFGGARMGSGGLISADEASSVVSP